MARSGIANWDPCLRLDGPWIGGTPAARSIRGGDHFHRLSRVQAGASLSSMDAEASPPLSISAHLRGVLNAARGVFAHIPRLALDIALPTLCVSCREPVDGEGVCAECWSKLSFIEPPYCPRLGIPFVYDPGPDLLSMEAIANPRLPMPARRCAMTTSRARWFIRRWPRPHRSGPRWPLDGLRRAGIARKADVLVPVLHWRRG